MRAREQADGPGGKREKDLCQLRFGLAETGASRHLPKLAGGTHWRGRVPVAIGRPPYQRISR
jgi:hypothetical protein